jgi:hypothetical protein
VLADRYVLDLKEAHICDYTMAMQWFMPGLPVLTAVCLLMDRAPFETVFDTYALDIVLTTFRRIEPLFYEQTDAREKAL